ncbi:rod shape-determining protein RodA [Patescibacteria group bacterium]|nr:rod shape-determining protein RodA [Patescibacteria group bacterium]
MNFLKFLKNFNWPLILPAFALTLFGLLSIYSFSSAQGNFFYFKKQLIFFAFSVFLVILLNFFDLKFLKHNSYFIFALYFLSLIALLGLYFFGVEIKGDKGWYKLGIFSFDPVPFAAIFLIAILSKYFAVRHIEIKRFQSIFFSLLYLAIPFFLILFQPDFGSAFILIFVWLGIVIFSGLGIRHFLILGLVALIIFVAAWQFWLKNYQKERVISFLNPKIDFQGISWNINQSKIAIGSGGFWGKGISNNSQIQYGFLPSSQTDFIFASIAEATGFFGILILIFFIIFLFSQIMKVALLAEDNFTRLFAIGFAFLLISQSFINIGMTLGLLPVVGIPLPFVSYGGSYILAFYLGLGMLGRLG